MNDSAYAQFISAWLATATEEQIEAVLKEEDETETPAMSDENLASWLSSLFGGGGDDASFDPNSLDPNTMEDLQSGDFIVVDPNDIDVPGPYGVSWPYVCEPIEVTIGTAKVTITIEDENAKMPLSWLVTNFKDVNKQAEDSLKTFGAWMQMTDEEVTELQASLEEIYKQKMFKVNPNATLLQNKPAAKTSQASQFSRRTYTRTAPGQRAPASASNTAQAAAANQRPASAHATDFAKLFHSSMLNQEIFMRPLPDTGERVENAYKYLSLWGAQRININTAPRHVLEAAFMLTLDAFEAPELAQKVIDIRKEKPFAKIEELKDVGMLDVESFNNLKNYIAVSSNFFKIRVTSSSGNASASAVATVIKEGKNVEPLAIMYGY
jgi:type II secretory pathway component PulK